MVCGGAARIGGPRAVPGRGGWAQGRLLAGGEDPEIRPRCPAQPGAQAGLSQPQPQTLVEAGGLPPISSV